MKDIVKYATLLFAVGSICSSLVIISYNVADPILNEREIEETSQALDTLYEGISYTYEDASEEYNLISQEVLDSLYIVEANNTQSYIYKISTPGKNGDIVYLLEVSSEGEVINIAYISQKETPGRGDKITLPNFTSMIIGSSNSSVNAETISGATISSQAVISSVEQALSHYESEVR